MGGFKWPEAEAAGQAAAPLKSVFMLAVGAAGGGVAVRGVVCVSRLHSRITSTLFKVFSVCGSPECIFHFLVYVLITRLFFKAIAAEMVT